MCGETENQTLKFHNDLADIVLHVGESLVCNGGEIYRAEESMQRILRAYNVQGDIFTIPSCIILTITVEHTPITRMMRPHIIASDFDKITKLNALSRYICTNTPDFDEIYKKIEEISSAPCYSEKTQILACGVGATAFAGIFLGTGWDCIAAFFCGMVVKKTMYKFESYEVNPFMIHAICSFNSAILALILVWFTPASNSDVIITAAFMNLVPGVITANFMRDIVRGDLISGLTKLTEAVLYSTAISCGVAVALYLGDIASIILQTR